MKNSKYLYANICIAATGGLLFGLNMAGIAGANDLIRNEFNLSATSLGTVAALLTIGCLIGALFTGKFAERYGRKPVMKIISLLYIISSLGCSFANSASLLAVFRILSGLAVGATSVVIPMYISEISPAKKRGQLVSMNQFAITIGILLAYVADYLLIGLGDDSWRYMLGVPAIFGLLFFILLLTSFPESPRWLLASGKENEAKKILLKLAGKATVEKELPEMKNSIELDRNKSKASFSELFKGKTGKVVLIGCLIASFQQITGINAIIIYAPDIFQSAGSMQSDSLIQSILVGVINFLMTIVAIWLVDRKGRKTLLLWGAAGMILSLGFLSYQFASGALNNLAIMISLLLYISFFAASFAPVVWVVISEIYPGRIKEMAMSLSTAVVWLCSFLTVQFAPVIKDQLGLGWLFGIFAFFSVLSYIFVKFFIPETKGKTLEQIEIELR